MVRENPDNIRKMLKDRDVQFDLDLLLELDKKRREMIISTDNLRKKKNEMSIKISEAKKTGSEATQIIQEMQLVSKELTKNSLPEIGDLFGGRDHTTVIHACKKIEELKSDDLKLSEDYNNIKRLLML